MFLEAVSVEKRAEVDVAKQKKPLRDLVREVSGLPPTSAMTLAESIASPGLGIIAEIKRRSPSRGNLGCEMSTQELARAYERGGAAAISVLTDGAHFGGSLADLQRAREVTSLPLLRKDFIIDEYQLFEAKAYGADAILLIVGLLKPEELARLLSVAREIGLDALVEVHSEEELERAFSAGADIIGVNSRDLRTLAVDTAAFYRLIPLIPEGSLSVAESGISQPDELRALRELGADAALIGTAIASCDDPERKLKEFVSGVKE